MQSGETQVREIEAVERAADLMTKAMDLRSHQELMARLPMTLHPARGVAGQAVQSAGGEVSRVVVKPARNADDVMIIGECRALCSV